MCQSPPACIPRLRRYQAQPLPHRHPYRAFSRKESTICLRCSGSSTNPWQKDSPDHCLSLRQGFPQLWSASLRLFPSLRLSLSLRLSPSPQRILPSYFLQMNPHSIDFLYRLPPVKRWLPLFHRQIPDFRQLKFRYPNLQKIRSHLGRGG